MVLFWFMLDIVLGEGCPTILGADSVLIFQLPLLIPEGQV